jgi:hypothetical protein
MTIVLVGLMFINGQLQYHISVQPSRNECETAARAARANYPESTVQPSRNECETAARAARANYPESTVICAAVPGQPT